MFSEPQFSLPVFEWQRWARAAPQRASTRLSVEIELPKKHGDDPKKNDHDDRHSFLGFFIWPLW